MAREGGAGLRRELLSNIKHRRGSGHGGSASMREYFGFAPRGGLKIREAPIGVIGKTDRIFP